MDGRLFAVWHWLDRLRAREIRSVNEDVAPVPGEVPASLASKLLDDFREIFREAATAAGAEIIAG